jgi:hypothetical protein
VGIDILIEALVGEADAGIDGSNAGAYMQKKAM